MRRIPFTFQRADRRIDLPRGGILGSDFLAHAGAKISYKTGILTLGPGSNKIHKVLSPINTKNQPNRIRKLVVPGRTETVVRLPVLVITRKDEGLTEKQEIREGMYLSGAITKVEAGYAITSNVNTTNEIDESVLKVTEVEPRISTWSPGDDSTGCYLDRPGEELKRLRLQHLNAEERKDTKNTLGISGYFSFTWRGAE